MMPLISIVVPVYNTEKYISRCLDSLINQTFKDIEIVVVNDGSTDNSRKILEKYTQKDGRIKVIDFETNKGLYEARLTGLENASGDYLCSCDSDDYYSNDALELMYEKAKEIDADIVQGKIITIYKREKIEGWFNKISYSVLKGTDILEYVIKEGRNWSMCCKLIKREVFIKSLKDYTRNMHLITTEDLMIFLPIAYRSKKQVSLEKDLYFYDLTNDSGSQIVGNFERDKKRLNDILKVGEEVVKFLLNKDIYENYREYHLKRICRDFFYYFIDFHCSNDIRIGMLRRFVNFEKDIILYLNEEYFKRSFISLDVGINIIETISVLFQFIDNNNLDGIYKDYLYELSKNIFSGIILEDVCCKSNIRSKLICEWVKRLGPLSISELDYIYKLKNIDFSFLNFDEKKIDKVKTIGIFCNQIYNGGIEKVVSQLSFLFSDRGYKIIVITENISEEDYDLNTESACVLLSRDFKLRYFDLKKYIEQFDIDLIIYNAWLDEKIRYDTFFIKYLGIKLCIIAHGAFSSCAWLTNNIDYFLYNCSFIKLADSLIALSEMDVYFYNAIGMKRVYYIPNPVTFNINDCRISKLENKTVLILSRFDLKHKRLISILEAFSKVLKIIPEARLLIVGTGGEYENDIVFNKIKELCIADSCDLTGFQKNVIPYILKSSVHVMASKFEGFPMALGEVRTYGVPTIMFDLPYLEMTKDGRGVIKVENGNTDALADAMINILNDVEYRKRLGKEARESIEYFLDYDIVGAWENVFNSILLNKFPNIFIGDEAKNTINELLNITEHYEIKIRELKKNVYRLNNIINNVNNLNKQLEPYFFIIIAYGHYIQIKILGIRITLKNKKYIDKPITITFDSILRNIFSVNISNENNNVIIRVLFFKITFNKKDR